MFEPRRIEASQRLTARQRAVVVAMNLLLLAELAWAMYHGQQDPGNLTAVFLRRFIPAAAITLMSARFLLRRLQPAPGETVERTP